MREYPLPPTPLIWLPGTQLHDAYTKCREYELRVAPECGPTSQARYYTHLLAARELGYLIIHAPSDDGRLSLAKEVLLCADDNALFDLGKKYNDHLIRFVQRSRYPTPPPTPEARHHRPDTSIDKLLAASPSRATAKYLALIRDGYHCLVEGTPDSTAVTYHLIPDKGYDQLPLTTDAAHIIPEINMSEYDYSTYYYEMQDGIRPEAVAAVVEQFSGVSVLLGDDVHKLENILTLQIDRHIMFRTLECWLEPTNTYPDQYEVKCPRDLQTQPSGVEYKHFTTFTSADPVRLPLPSARYLALHAACAKVAHLSSVWEVNDTLMLDMEGRDVEQIIEEDGSNTEVSGAAFGRVAL